MFALAAVLLLSAAPESNVVRSEHAAVRLVASASEIRAGKPVTTSTTQAYGCSVKY